MEKIAVAALKMSGYNKGVESNAKPLPAPRGLSVQQVARMLGYSEMTVRRMIRSGELVAWRPRGCHGRRWCSRRAAGASRCRMLSCRVS